jgi:hypothetical protein
MNKAESNWAEVAETLSRHGMSDTDIAAMREFQAQATKRKRAPKVAPAALDFGDWA